MCPNALLNGFRISCSRNYGIACGQGFLDVQCSKSARCAGDEPCLRHDPPFLNLDAPPSRDHFTRRYVSYIKSTRENREH